MVRITRIREGDKLIVRVSGKLEARHIQLLKAECEGVERNLVLDLSELQNADSEGLWTIHALIKEGAKTIGMQPFIALRLQRLREDIESTQNK